MARARDPNRDKAFELWKKAGGNLKLKDLAEKLGVSEGTVRGWKNKDRWDDQLNGTFQPSDKNAPKETERFNGTERDTSWIGIEKEYVTDIRRKPCTLKSLAEKYNIPLQTVKEYASRNDWTEKRAHHRTAVLQKTTEKTVELISNDIAKATARHFSASNKLLAVIEEALGDEQQFYKYVEKLRSGFGPGEFEESIEVEVLDSLNEAKLLNTVSALEKVQKMQRQLIGILDEKDRRKLEMDKRRLFGESEDEREEDDGFMEALDGKVQEIWGEEA
ncbi:phage terminase small subunit-related protein [Brevibacillus brevis]|uniref:phage terminase small subunit-related protein n=1 Tax=Brevibacillus brevis TaxID=1393 RepID=UPI0037CA1315